MNGTSSRRREFKAEILGNNSINAHLFKYKTFDLIYHHQKNPTGNNLWIFMSGVCCQSSE